MKKGIKKYFERVLEIIKIGMIPVTLLSFTEGIKNRFDILETIFLFIIGVFVLIPISLIMGFFISKRIFWFSERDKEELEKADKFWKEISKEAKENDKRKYFLTEKMFLSALIVFVLLPICWYGFKLHKNIENSQTLDRTINLVAFCLYIPFSFLSIYSIHLQLLVKLSGRKLVKMDKNNQEKFISK